MATDLDVTDHAGPVADGAVLRTPAILAAGSRVLVVEDDFMLADDLRKGLERLGHEVLGPVGSVAAALALLSAGADPDAAILDTHLDDETSYPVAAVLRTGRVPFVLATSLEPWAVPASLADVPLVPKPVSLRDLERRSG